MINPAFIHALNIMNQALVEHFLNTWVVPSLWWYKVIAVTIILHACSGLNGDLRWCSVCRRIRISAVRQQWGDWSWEIKRCQDLHSLWVSRTLRHSGKIMTTVEGKQHRTSTVSPTAVYLCSEENPFNTTRHKYWTSMTPNSLLMKQWFLLNMWLRLCSVSSSLVR